MGRVTGRSQPFLEGSTWDLLPCFPWPVRKDGPWESCFMLNVCSKVSVKSRPVKITFENHFNLPLNAVLFHVWRSLASLCFFKLFKNFYLMVHFFFFFWLCRVSLAALGRLLVVGAGTALPLVLRLLLWVFSPGGRAAGLRGVAHRLSCPEAHGIFLDQGSNWCLLQGKVDSRPPDPQGSPLFQSLHRHTDCYFFSRVPWLSACIWRLRAWEMHTQKYISLQPDTPECKKNGVCGGRGRELNPAQKTADFLSCLTLVLGHVLAVGAGVTHHLKLFSQPFPCLPFWSKCLCSQLMPSSWPLCSSPSTTGEDLSEEGAENRCERRGVLDPRVPGQKSESSPSKSPAGAFSQACQVGTMASFWSPLPLLLNRLVHSGPGKGSPQAAVDLSFATRTGTQQGIEAHLFRAEVSRDLSHWTRSIVQGTHASAELTAEVSTGAHRLWAPDVTALWEGAPSTASWPHPRFPYWLLSGHLKFQR